MVGNFILAAPGAWKSCFDLNLLKHAFKCYLRVKIVQNQSSSRYTHFSIHFTFWPIIVNMKMLTFLCKFWPFVLKGPEFLYEWVVTSKSHWFKDICFITSSDFRIVVIKSKFAWKCKHFNFLLAKMKISEILGEM